MYFQNNVTQGQYIDLPKGNYMNRAEIQNNRFGAQEVSIIKQEVLKQIIDVNR